MFLIVLKAKGQLLHLGQLSCLANSASPHGKTGQAILHMNTVPPPACLDPSQDASSLQSVMQKAECPAKVAVCISDGMPRGRSVNCTLETTKEMVKMKDI